MSGRDPAPAQSLLTEHHFAMVNTARSSDERSAPMAVGQHGNVACLTRRTGPLSGDDALGLKLNENG